MWSEFLKIRSLPTPRWTALAVALSLLAGVAISIIWGVGDENAVLEGTVNLPLWIASLIFGVWIFGVEFGQNTLRRTLAADPRRFRLILTKLVAVVLVVTAATVLLNLLGAVLFELAGSEHKYSIDTDLAVRAASAALLSNLVAAVVGMSLTMLTRSMVGGVAITLVFLLFIDTGLAFIPVVGEYTLNAAASDLDAAIRGDGETMFGGEANLDAAVAALVLTAWVAALFAIGTVRTLRSEVK